MKQVLYPIHLCEGYMQIVFVAGIPKDLIQVGLIPAIFSKSYYCTKNIELTRSFLAFMSLGSNVSGWGFFYRCFTTNIFTRIFLVLKNHAKINDVVSCKIK